MSAECRATAGTFCGAPGYLRHLASCPSTSGERGRAKRPPQPSLLDVPLNPKFRFGSARRFGAIACGIIIKCLHFVTVGASPDGLNSQAQQLIQLGCAAFVALISLGVLGVVTLAPYHYHHHHQPAGRRAGSKAPPPSAVRLPSARSQQGRLCTTPSATTADKPNQT